MASVRLRIFTPNAVNVSLPITDTLVSHPEPISINRLNSRLIAKDLSNLLVLALIDDLIQLNSELWFFLLNS